MARAETIESVGETGRGGNSPLPHHNTCVMPHTLPSLITANAVSRNGTGSIRLHPNHHQVHPLQGPYLYPLSYRDSVGQDESQTHQQLHTLSASPTPPTSLVCNRSEERSGGAVAPSAFSGEQPDLSRQGPLPDLLPQNEHASRSSPDHRAARGELLQQLEVRRVAYQLRAIGDEFNTTVLRRAHAAPHLRDWRDACRGLINFIGQTLSALYRLT